MSELQTENDQRRDDRRQRITPDMTLIEFLASPDEIGRKFALFAARCPREWSFRCTAIRTQRFFKSSRALLKPSSPKTT